MLSYMAGMANTGDSAKPWLIAICMIVSIIVVFALFIIGGNSDDKNDEDEQDGLF